MNSIEQNRIFFTLIFSFSADFSRLLLNFSFILSRKLLVKKHEKITDHEKFTNICFAAWNPGGAFFLVPIGSEITNIGTSNWKMSCAWGTHATQFTCLFLRVMSDRALLKIKWQFNGSWKVIHEFYCRNLLGGNI